MSLSMIHSLATRHWEGWGGCVKSWYKTASKHYPAYMVYETPMMEAYQTVFKNTSEDIIAYIHDDVEIYENGWDQRVLKEFRDGSVGLVGFAAGRGLGSLDLYEPPYEIRKFARQEFMSNLTDAELHGQRFTGECDVSTFDGLAIFVRRSILDACGGWPVGTPISYWHYDQWISCETRKQGFRSRIVGVSCRHFGGRSPSIISEDSDAAHLWLYEHYRGVMPMRVK